MPDMSEFAVHTGENGPMSQPSPSFKVNSSASNSLDHKASSVGALSPKGGSSTAVVSPKGSRAPSPVKVVPPKFRFVCSFHVGLVAYLCGVCSMKSEECGTEEYGQKSDKVYQFLSQVFTRLDEDNQGCFPVAQFWSIMKQLPLADLGMI